MQRAKNTAKSLLIVLKLQQQDHLKVESTLKKTHFYFKNVATAGRICRSWGKMTGKHPKEWTLLIGTGGYGGPR
jgi:hypothetical protein